MLSWRSMNNPIPYVIGISGGSGSGKTSIIRNLKEAIPNGSAVFVSQDDYYHSRDSQKVDENGIKNFDLPTSIDLDAFFVDLQKLMKGEPVERKEYVFNNDQAKPKILHFDPAKVIIVEGLFLECHDQLLESINLRVFVEARDNIKVIRRIRRDSEERNYPLEDVLYRYEQHVMPAYQKHILPYRDMAHIIINNNESFLEAVEVLSAIIRVQAHKRGYENSF